jgi:hypothetical protein
LLTTALTFWTISASVAGTENIHPAGLPALDGGIMAKT